MKILISLIGISIFLPGCTITGSLAYTDPETGATANVGVSHTADGKTLKRLRR